MEIHTTWEILEIQRWNNWKSSQRWLSTTQRYQPRFFLRFGTNSLIPKRDIRSDPTASKSFEFLEIPEIQENLQNTIVESMEIPKT